MALRKAMCFFHDSFAVGTRSLRGDVTETEASFHLLTF